MKRVLIDTNVILDAALQRKPFVYAADSLFSKIEKGIIKGFVTALSVSDIFYILRKNGGRENAILFIRELVDILEVLDVTKENIIEAINSDFRDFEDAIQYSVADMNQIDIIVTRNKADFKLSTIEVCYPDEL